MPICTRPARFICTRSCVHAPVWAIGPVGTGGAMRIAIIGATGNVGTALVAALAAEPAVGEIVGIARRPPPPGFPLTTFVQADIAHHDLADALDGADAVVHLAWEIQ